MNQLYQQQEYHRPLWDQFLDLFTIPHLVIFGLILLIIAAIVRGSSPKNVFSRWDHYIDNFNYPAFDFYTRLKQLIQEQDIKGAWVESAQLYQSNFASESRIYLRIEWEYQQYYVCCAPFGKGTFFSSWGSLYIGQFTKFLLFIPLVRYFVLLYLNSFTYYKYDKASMLHKCVHRCVLQVLDEISAKNGNKYTLTEKERTPRTKEVFQN